MSDPAVLETLEGLGSSLDHFFLIVMGSIVYLMQLGFALLEAGAVRSKNTTNILMKNIVDSAIGAVSYWVMGFAFAYGEKSNAFIGYSNFFLIDRPDSDASTWFFQYVFAATAATIVSGAMAERTKFWAYFVYCTCLTAFVYPIASHWVWDGKGWLAAEAPWDGVYMIDFAGSSCIHCLGGVSALLGTLALGPRLDLFNKDADKNIRIRGHSIPLMCLGGFILFFGFFAFNGGSQLSIQNAGDGEAVAVAVRNTVLGGFTAGIVGIAITFARERKFSLLMCINANLTGMVAMCAGCNVVEDWAAIIIGAVAGGVFIGWSELLFLARVDDPLDAVAVHLGGGLWGVLAAPIFHRDEGIFHTAFSEKSFQFFFWNLIGAMVICAWTAAIMGPVFFAMKFIGFLRVPAAVEMEGLDLTEHGEIAYPAEAYTHQETPLDHLVKNSSNSVLPQIVSVENKKP